MEALGSIPKATTKQRQMETEIANVTEMGGVKDRNNDRDGGKQGVGMKKKGRIQHSSLRTLQGNRTKVHRARSSSPTRLYKPQGAQHNFYEEESQAMAIFRKQAHVEEMCHPRQLLGTQKDKDEVWALSTR